MLPWIAAILLGALVPAVIVAGLSANLMILQLAFAVTLGHSMILGLPVALLYRAKRWTRLSVAVVGAFLIGALPAGFVTWPLSLSLRTTASVDGVATIIDGVPTLAGWLGYLQSLATFGALGAVGGVVFWLTLRCSGMLTATDPESTRLLATQSRIGVLLTGAAVAASIAVVTLPAITKDRSCHNMFRDGRRSVAPKVAIDVDITMDDWPRLTTLLEEFGTSHGMSFRNSNDSKPDVKVLGLSACSEQGLVISADDLRWASRNYAPIMVGGGVPIGVFDLADGIGWQLLAQDLVAVLESEWRGKVRFRDGDGRFVPGIWSRTEAAPSH
jgi:hypothetical protein